MKKNLPLIIFVIVVIAAAAYFLRQYSPNQTGSMNAKQNVVPTGSMTGTPSATSKDAATVKSGGMTLTVSSPANNAVVSSAKLTVRGKTVTGAEVYVNDVAARVDAAGNFSAALTLDEGDNYILIVANDATGTYVEKELTVTYSP